MPFLLDTNTCIDLMRKQPDVVKRMFAVAPGDCFVSTVSTYELYTGIAKCAAPDRERAKVDLLLRTLNELAFDQTAAREAGKARGALESQGEMIGPYDLLIAAQALSSGLTLVTSNTKEFLRVPGLIAEDWRIPLRRAEGA